MLVSMELGQGCHNCPEYPEKPNFFLNSISILLFGHFLTNFIQEHVKGIKYKDKHKNFNM